MSLGTKYTAASEAGLYMNSETLGQWILPTVHLKSY